MYEILLVSKFIFFLFSRIEKLLNPKVQDALKSIPHSEGTSAYLKLIDSVMTAYVRPNIPSYERMRAGVFGVEFVRQWREYLFRNNLLSPTYRLTDNVWESLELNLAFLYRMVKDGLDHFIHILNSQQNEKWFRKLRSFTGMESTIANCTMKSFAERLKYIEFEETALINLQKSGLKVPTLDKRINNRENTPTTSPLTDLQIESAVREGKITARELCNQLGMPFATFTTYNFCMPVTFEQQKEKEQKARENKKSNPKKTNKVSILPDTGEEMEVADDFFEIAGLKFSITPSSTYELFLANGKMFRKDKLVHILFNDTTYISTDLKERFKPRGALTITPRVPILNILWQNETISKGDYAIFKEGDVFFGGLVFTFMNNNRVSIKSSTIYKDIIEIDTDSDINIIMHPVFEISSSGLMLINDFEKFFFCYEYISHAKDYDTLKRLDLIELIENL